MVHMAAVARYEYHLLARLTELGSNDKPEEAPQTSHHAYKTRREMDFSKLRLPNTSRGVSTAESRARTWSIEDARKKLEEWRQDYNHERPHSALANLPPAAFAAGAVRSKINTNNTQNRQLGTGKNST